MNKYRIQIEYFDYDGNLTYQYQAEVSEELIHVMKNTHGIDALDELWNQLKYQFFQNKEKKNQKQLLIEMMETDHEYNLYRLSREDVEQIIKTCENPPEPNDNLKNAVKSYKAETLFIENIKLIDEREIKKCVYKILDAFCNRAGFIDWWYDLGEEIEQEIIKELEGIISKRINKSTKNKYLKSKEAQELFQKIVERDTWEEGLPKIYMDKKGNIVEHWKDGTINIIKTKDMTKEQAKDELIEVLGNQMMDLTMMSKIELGDDVIKEIIRLQEIINQE